MFNKILIVSVACCLSQASFAKTRSGSYLVPNERPDNIYASEVKYGGKNIIEADEFEVLFPLHLVGVENRFMIKKTGPHQWSGDEKLFSKVECGYPTENQFECRLEFQKSAVVIDKPIYGESATINTNPQQLMINKSLAIENMMNDGMGFDVAGSKIINTDDFINEPIGVLKYSIDKDED
ncbi:MAG: hypothetical protein KDD33_08825 [Bdellovibrionales bacterium]|nr:hypothetical protein [Bdellovibrionales bacterium]